VFKGGQKSAEAVKAGSLGGKARADALAPERRKQIAREAAKRRWAAFYAARRARLDQAR